MRMADLMVLSRRWARPGPRKGDDGRCWARPAASSACPGVRAVPVPMPVPLVCEAAESSELTEDECECLNRSLLPALKPLAAGTSGGRSCDRLVSVRAGSPGENQRRRNDDWKKKLPVHGCPLGIG